MAQPARPRVVGFNHIALEVGDIEEALAFYGRLFTFELRGKSDTMAFIDLGDQFIALQEKNWLPFLDTYRTMCMAPEPAFRHVLEELGRLQLAA
jgi:catechol 2,3-dioxygenase-like lactoylglutathione lyase family enzyme